jgi:hypothetical protein
MKQKGRFWALIFKTKIDILIAEVMNIVIFWDMTPCSPYVKRSSSEMFLYIRTTWRYIPKDDNI